MCKTKLYEAKKYVTLYDKLIDIKYILLENSVWNRDIDYVGDMTIEDILI